MSRSNQLEIYPHAGAPFTATLDEDADDGTWIVWDGTYHRGIGLTEEEAKNRADDLNERLYADYGD